MESIGVYRSRDVRPGQDPEKQDARVHLHWLVYATLNEYATECVEL